MASNQTVTDSDLIERWSNAERVLEAMPEHDRQRHWDMSSWGYKNDCGTIACAAGHCGMDPWFREHGFELTFRRGANTGDISDVPSFFGQEGASRIFFDATKRSVETVIAEVRGFTNELRQIAEISARISAPKIGEVWPQQGGVYAGVRIGTDGPYSLIVGPECDELNWADANDWAAGLVVNDLHDFVLPNRSDMYALYDRVRDQFRREAYWSGEQCASDSNGAWGQDFNDGYQYAWGKNHTLRARAVRRLAI